MRKIYILVISSLLVFTSCDPFNNIIENKSDSDAAYYYSSKSIKTPTNISDTLKITTWNIKFGGGRINFFFDCYGDRVLMKKEEVISNMNRIGNNILHMDPDILFLQEIDINSKRSAYVDQLQWILDHTDLNYAYYGSQWKSDYIPSDGIGKMNSGSAILSKYKLDDAERIPLPLIGEQSAIVQYFYLRRNILKAKVTVNNKEFIALTTHTSAYSTDDTKLKQLQKIKEQIDSYPQFVIGGDFNTIPPNSIVYENYDDDACADDPDFAAQSSKNELDIMTMFTKNYTAAIPQDVYDNNNSLYYSFTSKEDGFWNRKLDYIFTNGTFVTNSGLVHQDNSSGGYETLPLSDHAPVSVKYVLK